MLDDELHRIPGSLGGSFEEEVMQILKNVGAVAVLGVVIAACGGSGPTQAPGATQSGGGGGGAATQQPAGTEGDGGNAGNGGNGGNTIGTQYGKVTFTVTGAITAKGELGFVPLGSMFGGSQGSVFNFASTADGGQGSLVSVANNADGTVSVSYSSSADGQVPGASCTTSDWNVGANSASGKFDCTSVLSISASGAAVGPSTIKGEFTAHT